MIYFELQLFKPDVWETRTMYVLCLRRTKIVTSVTHRFITLHTVNDMYTISGSGGISINTGIVIKKMPVVGLWLIDSRLALRI